jgi:chaperonin GroES
MARNHLRPLFDRVVIKELEPDRMRQSGLLVPPGSHEPPPQHGIVLAVGQGVDWWEAAGVQMPVRPGDHVVFPASAGAWVEVDEERLLVCRVTELLGVLERVEEPLPDARLGDARGEGWPARRGLTAGSAGVRRRSRAKVSGWSRTAP